MMISNTYKGVEILSTSMEAHIPLTDSYFEGEQAYILACKEIDTLQAKMSGYMNIQGDLVKIINYEGLAVESLYDEDENKTVSIISLSQRNAFVLVTLLNLLLED